ncbi:stringent starvation protein B [Vibrio phage 1.031.O._10N.261.46.F8]|nr:stringent starvation protein B [Vibrio phage 1.031.O._10N.261.46.F8]
METNDSLTYAVVAKSSAILSCIRYAHLNGDRIELVVIESLTTDGKTYMTDPVNNLPSAYYKEGSMLVNLSSVAIGNHEYHDESSSIWFEGAFGGKKGEFYVPVGSIAAVRVNGEMVYVCDHFFIIDMAGKINGDAGDGQSAGTSDAIDEYIKESGANVVNIFNAPKGVN